MSQLYHYLFDDKAKDGILKDLELKSINQTLNPDKLKDYAVRAKEKGYGNTAEDYFKAIYKEHYRQLLDKDYDGNYGVYTTPLDLKGIGDFKHRLKIPINDDILNSSIYSVGAKRKLLNKVKLEQELAKYTPEVTKKIWESSKLKFKRLPQVTTFKNIPVTTDMLESL